VEKELNMPGKQEIGERIKRVRLARNLTLKEVERKAKVSATHISEIERGLTSPTIGALQRIAAALETPPYDFVASVAKAPARIVRSDERAVFTDARHGGRFQRLGRGVPGAELSAFVVELDAGAARPQPLLHDGEEFFHVLRGVVEVEVPGSERPVVLKEGDSVHLRGPSGRTARNIGDGPASVLWIVVPMFCL